MTFHPYVGFDPPCSGGSMPGTMNLAYVLTMLFDQSISMGIYNCRPPSTHGDGRAYDMGFRGVSNPQGNVALAALIEHAWDLGITELIWKKAGEVPKRYTASYPWGRTYTGPSPHSDHIHIGQTPAYAASLTQAQAFAILEEDMLTPEQEATLNELVLVRRQLAAMNPISGFGAIVASAKLVRIWRNIDDIADATEV